MGSTYEIRVDGETKAEGNMKDDWSFEKPKKIKDPEQSKPEDWVDNEEIDDPNDKKPDDWDDEPASIADPDATKPDDWEDEEDGEWQAPQIDNPDYKVNGRQKRFQIQIIRDHGYIRRLIIQNMWRQKMCISEDQLDIL